MAEIDRQLYAGPSELDVSFYLKRPYAPLGDRLAALRRHLLGYGGFLAAARDNLGSRRRNAHGSRYRGRGYALKTFHGAFLGCGSMPIPLIREVIG